MLNQDFMLSMVRHLLTLGAGFLVSKGMVDQVGADSIIGGLIAASVAVWSWTHHVGTPST